MQVRALETLLRRLPAPRSLPLERAITDRPGIARRLEGQQVQELIEGYRAGAAVYTLGDKFGIDRRLVSTILNRCGVEIRHHGPTPGQIQEAIRLYEGGSRSPG